MTVFLNGEFVAEERARVSVLDRGFTYGDGIFETLLVVGGAPFRWDAHLARLRAGADFIGLGVPVPEKELRAAADKLIAQNPDRSGGVPAAGSSSDAVLRIILSRGVGPRGYSPAGAGRPTIVISVHPAPPTPSGPWRVRTSSHRVRAGDPLLRYKTCNKLLQVLARREAERAGFDEALIFNERDEAVTAAAANLFYLSRECVCTPPISAGALPGTTRALVFEICSSLGLPCIEASITGTELRNSPGIFLTSSTLGLVPVAGLDAQALAVPEIFERLQDAYAALRERESSAA